MSFDDDMSIEEQVARLVVSDTDTLARKVKEMGGTSYGTSNLTPDAELWAWTHRDDTIDENQLRAAGMPESEINTHLYPLQSKLMAQAGRTFDDQKRYHDRMWERAYRAQAAGRTPKPPARQGGIEAPKLEPVKDI